MPHINLSLKGTAITKMTMFLMAIIYRRLILTINITFTNEPYAKYMVFQEKPRFPKIGTRGLNSSYDDFLISNIAFKLNSLVNALPLEELLPEL